MGLKMMNQDAIQIQQTNKLTKNVLSSVLFESGATNKVPPTWIDFVRFLSHYLKKIGIKNEKNIKFM